ncbi:tetratricopeptide repeat protein [Stenotrophomonas terrae]|uniref:tetratricopeptide repeat protein n=1 Tax=Stenotrophomonas terrae TaxID=405446 RepID=UPI00320A71DA
MSLIHDALSGGESSPAADRQTAQTAAWQQLPRHGRWLLLGVVLAGPAGYLLARGGGNEQAPIAAATPIQAPASLPGPAAMPPAINTSPGARPGADPATQRPVQTAGVRTLPPIVLATRVAPAAPIAAAAATSANIAAAAPGAVTSTAPSVREATSAVTITVSQAPAKSASATSAPTSGDEPDPMQVKTAMSRLQAAVASGDNAVRDTSLSELQALLPADSLTLLRARAWAAHGNGDIEDAERYYRAILQRVPDDEYAGVNLALIDARRGDLNQARDRLAKLAARNTGSQMVSRAQAELETARQ